MQKSIDASSEKPITIGEVAKKLDVTVRTLQYYDKEGLLTPSATTAGGRRFYTKHDMVKLHQILSMKYLGFSLDDIKNRLTDLRTPQDVVSALTLQKQMFSEQIARLSEALTATEALQQEVEQMQSVDFDRYAEIIVLLRQKSDSYWLFKLFNERLSSHVSERFSDKLDVWAALFVRWKNACDTTILLDRQGENPASKKAQTLAKEWWDMTLEFSGGDLSLIGELQKFEEGSAGWNEDMKFKIHLAQNYRSQVLKIYLQKNNIKL